MKRLIYTTRQSIKHRKKLSEINQNGHGSIYQVDFDRLKSQGIKTIVFDFDGVLSGHGEPIPHKTVQPILQKSCDLFGAGHVFILSNKPTKTRDAYFKQQFPNIQFIFANRKKPYPDGLQKILNITGDQPEAIALVDDRLLTGGLATCITNTKAIYINKPLTNDTNNKIPESFFALLRKLERWLFK